MSDVEVYICILLDLFHVLIFSGSHYKALKRPRSVTAPLCDFHQPFGFLFRYVFESGKTDVLENMSKRTNFTSRKTHGTKTHCSICYTVHEKH